MAPALIFLEDGRYAVADDVRSRNLDSVQTRSALIPFASMVGSLPARTVIAGTVESFQILARAVLLDPLRNTNN
jgi:hypothetical protein